MEKVMSGLFINYRREDTAPYAGRLYDHLRRAFPNNSVFMDIDAIDPGEDFVHTINQTLTASKVVLAVIGPRWEQITDGSGNRRLDNPDDYVVRELSAALEAEARVIPVLVGGAAMPRSEVLPPRLQGLARRNAIEISDTRFAADADRLATAIARAIDPSRSNNPQEPARHFRTGIGDDARLDSLTTFKTLLWTGYALGVLSVGVQLTRVKEEEVAGFLIFAVLLLCLAAWFNVMLTRGRNWARMAYLALLIVSVPAMFVEWSEQSSAETVLNFISLGLSIWLLRLMFTDPIKARFRGTTL
jgi:hypothetical protein